MTSDLCIFFPEVATPYDALFTKTCSHSHRLPTPSSQDYHRYCISVTQTSLTYGVSVFFNFLSCNSLKLSSHSNGISLHFEKEQTKRPIGTKDGHSMIDDVDLAAVPIGVIHEEIVL